MQSDPNPIELSAEFSSPSRAGAAMGRVDGRLNRLWPKRRIGIRVPLLEIKASSPQVAGVPPRSIAPLISCQHFDGYSEELNRLWIAWAKRDRASYS
jgi:hypothetical protein